MIAHSLKRTIPFAAILAISGLLLLAPFSRLLASNRFTFDTFENFTAVGPKNICSADFNGDGIADLASDGSCISILMGIGDGTFRPMVRYVPDEERANYTSLIAADFNNDGATDLSALSPAYPYMLVIALNDGSGAFTPGILIPTAGSTFPAQLAPSDFNGDGNEDIALLYAPVSSAYWEVVSIFLSNGDGTFQPEVATNVSKDMDLRDMRASDLDGDGNIDLVLTDSFYQEAVILLGRGDGTFREGMLISDLGGNPLDITVADLDLDGDCDLAFICAESSYFYVLFNEGDGKFADPYAWPIVGWQYGYPSSLSASDLDGDGDADMIVSHAKHFTIFENDGAGAFTGLGGYSVDGDFPMVCVGDFDRDGDRDLAGTSAGSGHATILLNNGDATFRHADFYSLTYVAAINSSDFNGDGIPDLAAAFYAGGEKLAIYLGDGEGAIQHSVDYAVSPEAQWVDIADYNSDTYDDITLSNRGPNTVSILLGYGDGTFQSKTDYAAGGVAIQTCSADLDGDGALDLAVTNSIPSQIAILFGNGDGTFQSPVIYASPADLPQPYSICAADFDGDGDTDLAVGASECTWKATSLGVFMNNGDGTFLAPTLYYSEWGTRIVAADLDRDGDVDIAATHSEGLTIHLNNGSGTFQVFATYGIFNTISFCLSDLNHDGELDIATCGLINSPAINRSLLLLAGNGDGSFEPPQTFNGLLGASITATDLENDGDPDLIIADSYRIMVTHNLASVATAIGGEAPMPALPFLSQNFPNPFNPSTTFRVSLPTPGHARIVAYDSAGRLVAVIADRYFPAGVSEVVWHGRDERGEALASGVYFARMTMNGRALAKKVLLLR